MPGTMGPSMLPSIRVAWAVVRARRGRAERMVAVRILEEVWVGLAEVGGGRLREAEVVEEIG